MSVHFILHSRTTMSVSNNLEYEWILHSHGLFWGLKCDKMPPTKFFHHWWIVVNWFEVRFWWIFAISPGSKTMESNYTDTFLPPLVAVLCSKMSSRQGVDFGKFLEAPRGWCMAGPVASAPMEANLWLSMEKLNDWDVSIFTFAIITLLHYHC